MVEVHFITILIIGKLRYILSYKDICRQFKASNKYKILKRFSFFKLFVIFIRNKPVDKLI